MKEEADNQSAILDDPDFVELVIRHLLRDSKTLEKAKAIKLKAEDFGSIDVYQAFVNIALEVGQAPVDRDIFMLHLRDKFRSAEIMPEQKEVAVEFMNYCYSGELNSAFIVDKLPKFVRRKRLGNVKRIHDNDAEALLEAMNECAIDLEFEEVKSKGGSLSPFLAPVEKQASNAIGTGFNKIDGIVKGIGRGEYGLILGHSGAGKTALACAIAMNVVKDGLKVLYISLEEPAANVVDRFYANKFEIEYSRLHRRDTGAQMEINTRVIDLPPDEREKLGGLRVDDKLRDHPSVNANVVIAYLEELAAEGYIPDVVFVDQMDYLDPINEVDSQWQKYERVSFEFHEVAKYKIQGTHQFGFYLLHQAAGKMKRTYTNAEIAGFKGILKPCDLVVCIGKDSPDDVVVTVFSLKSRHSKNFCFDFIAQLEFMKFVEDNAAVNAQRQIQDQVRQSVRRGRAPDSAAPPPEPTSGVNPTSTLPPPVGQCPITNNDPSSHSQYAA